MKARKEVARMHNCFLVVQSQLMGEKARRLAKTCFLCKVLLLPHLLWGFGDFIGMEEPFPSFSVASLSVLGAPVVLAEDEAVFSGRARFGAVRESFFVNLAEALLASSFSVSEALRFREERADDGRPCCLLCSSSSFFFSMRA